MLVIEEVDVVLFMVDVCVGLMLVDEVIVKYLCFCEKLIFLVVNKIDGLDFD